MLHDSYEAGIPMPWLGTAQLNWYTNSILDWRVHIAFLETTIPAKSSWDTWAVSRIPLPP